MRVEKLNVSWYRSDMKKITIEFREVPGFKGYFVSSCGMVVTENYQKGHAMKALSLRSHTTKCWVVNLTDPSGSVKTMRVHRLVAMAFLDNPNNRPQVNHINGDRYDNSVDNLEWTTDSKNKEHRCRALKHRGGFWSKYKSKMVNENLDKIISDIKSGMKQTAIAEKYGVSASCISLIKSGKRSCFKKYIPEKRVPV